MNQQQKEQLTIAITNIANAFANSRITNENGVAFVNREILELGKNVQMIYDHVASIAVEKENLATPIPEEPVNKSSEPS